MKSGVIAYCAQKALQKCCAWNGETHLPDVKSRYKRKRLRGELQGFQRRLYLIRFVSLFY